MATQKTVPNNADVKDFLSRVTPDKRREDALKVSSLMQQITGESPKMWGSSIVGFGSYHYKYASGREGEWMRIGFSPRKTALTLYIMSGFSDYQSLMAKLGKYKTGKSCLYIKNLDDIDQQVLIELMKKSLAYMKETYPD